MKIHELYILWGWRNNNNLLSVLELWVSEVGVWDKRSNWVVKSFRILLHFGFSFFVFYLWNYWEIQVWYYKICRIVIYIPYQPKIMSLRCLAVEIILREDISCICFRITVVHVDRFENIVILRLPRVSLQPMVLYVVLISPIKILDMKII